MAAKTKMATKSKMAAISTIKPTKNAPGTKIKLDSVMEGYNNTQNITPTTQADQLFNKVSYSTALTTNTFESFEAKWEGY